MTICRFFAQGTCRYGDRCRFEHVTNSYNYNKQYTDNQWNTGRYEQRHGSNYNRYDNEYRNQRYESRNYYSEDYKGSDRYNENFGRSSNQNKQQQYRNKQEYNQQYSSNDQNYGRKHDQYYEYENENAYGQNRFRWLSDDYKNQARLSTGPSEYDYRNESYTTSTPKGKPSFSFKVPESEVKKGSNVYIQVDEQDQMLSEKVLEDTKSWELGGQWPFTCYFPFPNKCAFPRFYDVSPEELRYAAYKAEQIDSSKVYIQYVQYALTQIDQQRSELQVATPQLLSILRKINNGEDLYSASQKINPIAFIESDATAVEIMDTPDISVASSNAAALFSFKTPDVVSNAAASFSFKAPETIDRAAVSPFGLKAQTATNAASSLNFKIPSETDSASNFSFKLPSSSETKFVPTTASDGDVNIYTLLGNLTEEEKEQFSASTFILGKIPTRPPSLVFCN